MRSSTYSINTATQTGRYTDTWTSFGRSIPHWNEPEFEDLMAGPAGVISSVEDLALWTRVFLNGGIDPATNVTIIPSAGFDAVTSAHSIVSPDTSAQSSTNVYGLGWGRLSYAGHDVSHSPQRRCTGGDITHRCCRRGWRRGCRARECRLEGRICIKHRPHGCRDSSRLYKYLFLPAASYLVSYPTSSSVYYSTLYTATTCWCGGSGI
ncbi:hypothetical protein BJV77DRAFT_304874 [Russula vinacea]|nr:hypothetical protein BJV77DRAFT_304874 [Russula vinacea]